MENTLFPSDTLVIAIKANTLELGEKLSNIANNTDSFNTVFTGTNTIVSFVAGLVTIFGIGALFANWINKRMSTKKQTCIILDLMRHFMQNNAILEVVLQEKGNNRYPIEGTFSRFATLDKDTDIGRLSVSANQYEKLHNLSLSIRNYNSIVTLVDKHITDPSYPDELLTKELLNIKDRSNIICKKLIELSKSLHRCKCVTEKDFAEYIQKRYETDLDKITSEIKDGTRSNYLVMTKHNGEYYKSLKIDKYYEMLITKQAQNNLIFYERVKNTSNQIKKRQTKK